MRYSPGTKSAAVPMGLNRVELNDEYRTGDDDLVEDFYKPCLARARRYDRAVGYFRSTVFVVAAREVVNFAAQHGKIRIVCSPVLHHEDVEALATAHARRDEVIEELLDAEITRLLASPTAAMPTVILATLVACGSLQIRLAVRPPAHGIYHEKLGIFADDAAGVVTFKGSSNETWNGWHPQGNLESFEVFCSWRSGEEAARTSRHEQYFERLWQGEVTGVSTLDFPAALRQRLLTVARESFDQIDFGAVQAPMSTRPLLPHQRGALEAWKAAGCRGIFEHATGSGKTITALGAIKEHVAAGDPALVVVPSVLLLDQWADEIAREVPEAVVLLAGAGHEAWKRPGRLRSFASSDRSLGPRIILSTMQTAAAAAFRSRLRPADHLLVVVDEVHQAGSPENSHLFEVDAGKRLGLSATPRRFGDPAGTAKILEYFVGVVGPVITLSDAMAAGRLVEYEYHPHPMQLSAEEAGQWKKLTLRIRHAMGGARGDGNLGGWSEEAKKLLVRRARIAKKAEGKVGLAERIIVESFSPGDRWLVYCEDADQLRQVVEALAARGLRAVEYHTAMRGDQAATLKWFRDFGGILVSIRCLDEGVDIPETSHALILASSQNPRQFIQRRGRVLRKAGGKYLAVLHDVVVVPVDLQMEPEQASLLRSEFARAVEFSKSAINPSGAMNLRDIAARLGFDADETLDDGLEEEPIHE